MCACEDGGEGEDEEEGVGWEERISEYGVVAYALKE